MANPLLKPAAPNNAEGGKSRGDHVSYQEGHILFEQGMPGGDLYFIESGEVEIYTRHDNQDIVLSTMNAGEIIGVMTCLTSEPRMASARAKTAVACKVVSHDHIKKAVAEVPAWMKIVLKEFSIRLAQMNSTYSDAVSSIKWLEGHQLSSVYTGAQIAAAFVAVAELTATPSDLGKFVVVADMLGRLEQILNLRRPELEKIFAILDNCGLVKAGIDPGTKRIIVRLEHMHKLTFFADFVRNTKDAQAKKLVKTRFTHKELRVMTALIRFTEKLELDKTQVCRLNLADLRRSLEKATTVAFDPEALEQAAELGLLVLGGEEEPSYVAFKPQELGRILSSIEALRRLEALDHTAAKRV